MFFDKSNYASSPKVFMANSGASETPTPNLSRNSSINSSQMARPMPMLHRTLSSASTTSSTSSSAILANITSVLNVTDDLAYLRDENQRYRANYHQLSNRCNELEDQIAQLQARLDENESARVRAQEETHQLRRRLIDQIELSEYERLKTELDGANQNREKALADIRDLHRELQQAQESSRMLQQENLRLQTEADAAQAEKVRILAEKTSLESCLVELSETQASFDNYKERLSEVLAENEELKASLQRSANDTTNLKCQMRRRTSTQRSQNQPSISENFMPYDQLACSNVSLTTLSSYPNVLTSNNQHLMMSGSQIGQTMTMTPGRRYAGITSNPGAAERPESLAASLRTQSLEIQLDDERQERAGLEKQIGQLQVEKRRLELELVLHKERIKKLEADAESEARQNEDILNLTDDELISSNRSSSLLKSSPAQIVLITKTITSSSPIISLSHDRKNGPGGGPGGRRDDQNNNPKKRFRDEVDSDGGSSADADMTPEIGPGGLVLSEGKSPKKKKKRWLRFLVCGFHS